MIVCILGDRRLVIYGQGGRGLQNLYMSILKTVFIIGI